MRHEFRLTLKERRALRLAALGDASADVRRRTSWLLALDSGVPVAALARAVGASRPTVYFYAAVWLRFRSVEALRTKLARALVRAKS